MHHLFFDELSSSCSSRAVVLTWLKKTSLLFQRNRRKPFKEVPPVFPLPYSSCSRNPISRAELAITGIKDNSCKSAPVTGARMPGIANPVNNSG